VQGYLLMISAINGFTMDETGVGDPAEDQAWQEPSAKQEAADMASSYLKSLPPEHFPNLVELSPEFGLADNDERFELLLDIFRRRPCPPRHAQLNADQEGPPPLAPPCATCAARRPLAPPANDVVVAAMSLLQRDCHNHDVGPARPRAGRRVATGGRARGAAAVARGAAAPPPC